MKYTQDRGRQRECTVETIAWLHQAWELMQQGQTLQPDPFYPRNEKLTPEIVADVLSGIETLFANEFSKYEGYHRAAQGISASEYNVPPKFLKLAYPQQFAIVQGIDRIFQGYKGEEAAPEPVPADYWNEGD